MASALTANKATFQNLLKHKFANQKEKLYPLHWGRKIIDLSLNFSVSEVNIDQFGLLYKRIHSLFLFTFDSYALAVSVYYQCFLNQGRY